MNVLIAGVACLGLALVACGGNDDSEDGPGTAEDALRRQLEYVVDGQAAKHYEELHPAQQAAMSREDHAACIDSVGSVDLVALKVVRVTEKEITIAGTDQKAMATVIDAELTIRSGVPATVETGTSTFQEVMLDGEWRVAWQDLASCA